MPMVVGNVELYMGPREVGGPDDLQKTIVKFIDGAKKRLDIAVQELDCENIAKAIVRAKHRGAGGMRSIECFMMRSFDLPSR